MKNRYAPNGSDKNIESGDILIGREDDQVVIIIGEEGVLARKLAINNEPIPVISQGEKPWTLACRDWQVYDGPHFWEEEAK